MSEYGKGRRKLTFEEKVERHAFNKVINADPDVKAMNKHLSDTTPGARTPARRRLLLNKIMEGRDGQDI
jgi:phage head maturation protease